MASSDCGKDVTVTIQEAFKEFVAEQEYKGNTERTVEFYTETLNFFLAEAGITQLEELDEKTIRTWLVNRRHLSPNTLRTYDRGLRIITRWFFARGYIEAFPMKNLPKPKAKSREIVTFTPEDIKAMMAEADRREERLRDKALLILLLDTGIRIGEARNLFLHSVNWQENILTVSGKTGERPVPFSTPTRRSLKTYIDQERRASAPSVRHLFLTREGTPMDIETITKHVRRIAVAADVQATRRGAHTFRHTFAVEYIRAGGDVFSLQKILGHTTLEMTRVYVHLAKSDLREAHRKFSPVSRML